MKVPQAVFATWISLVVIFQGSHGSEMTSSPTQHANEDGSTSGNPNNPQDSCWYGLCIEPYAKYYNEIILGKKDFQLGMWDYLGLASYKSAMQYFRVLDYTPIPSIKAAFETCLHYKKNTKEKCEQFFSVFLAKGYTIDLIAEYCAKNPTICDDAEKKLNIYYHQDVTLQDNTLKFFDCLEGIKGDSDPIIFDNLRLVRLSERKRRENKDSRNRCSCHQVHALASAFRDCYPGAQIREFYAPPEFNEFLSAICITTDVTDPSLMWTPDMINSLVGFMVGKSNERFLLTKEILLGEKDIVPIYIQTSKDWTLRYIFETAYNISGGIADYKRAVDLIVRGMKYVLFMDTFRLFLQTTDVITSRIEGQITLPNSPPLKSQFLTLKSLFFTQYTTMNYPFTDMFNRCSLNANLYLKDVLDFFMEYYISESK